jgi:HAD superfamily hydrolase (TIGR01549 family)
VSGADRRAGVLFDVDGTLVDTTYLHAVCWAEAMRHHGRQIPASRVHYAIGMSSEQLLDACLGDDRNRDDDDAMVDAHLTLYRQWWGRLVPLPGAAKLLYACADRGLEVVLASSASQEELAVLRDALDADDAITAATSSADAEQGKPDPGILQAALDQSGLEPQHVAFVGDAVWDGQAARRIEVPFVGLTCGGTPETELRDAGAGEVWRDPAELLEHIDESLIARTR